MTPAQDENLLQNLLRLPWLFGAFLGITTLSGHCPQLRTIEIRAECKGKQWRVLSTK